MRMVGSKLCYLKLLWENGGGMGRRERKTFCSKFGTVLITFHPRCKLNNPFIILF